MAYDARSEGRRLIADGLPDRPVRLSRRRRFAPVAVDVDGDVAATWFVRRGVACYWDEIHLFAHDHSGWNRLGGGGGQLGRAVVDRRVRPCRADLSAGWIQVTGGASVNRDAGGLLPWGARWIHSAELLVGPEAAVVVVDGRRRLPVPNHGRLVVVWTRRPPRVSALDGAGRELASREVLGR